MQRLRLASILALLVASCSSTGGHVQDDPAPETPGTEPPGSAASASTGDPSSLLVLDDGPRWYGRHYWDLGFGLHWIRNSKANSHAEVVVHARYVVDGREEWVYLTTASTSATNTLFLLDAPRQVRFSARGFSAAGGPRDNGDGTYNFVWKDPGGREVNATVH